MPYTHDLQINIDGQSLEIGQLADAGIRLSYGLEDPENFEQKQGSTALDLDVPATPNNSKIFNTFEHPNVEDMTGDDYYKNPRPCEIIVNGITILKGKSLLESATHSRLPGKYTFNCYGNTGDWVIDMKDLTLWDCLSTVPHDFTVANVEASWTNFDSDEDHDYVYAPVRYRQPFGINDDSINIYALRPSISIYWLIIRAFRMFGYTINSQFLNTANYFRRMVMPWVWGDFFDINSQLTDGISFKAVGAYPVDATTGNNVPGAGALTEDAFIGYGIWMALQPVATTGSLGGGTLSASTPQADTSFLHWDSSQIGSGDHYIMSTAGRTMPWTDGSTFNSIHNMQTNFRINYTQPPLGYDNFTLYSFDESTGTMKWTYAPPAGLSPLIGNGITANFALNFFAFLSAASGSHCDLFLEIKHFDSGSSLLGTTTTQIIDATGAGQSGANGCFGGGGIPGDLNIPLSNAWLYNFSVPGINIGDFLEMRLKWNASGTAQSISIASSFYFNANPTVTGANPWQYNPITEQWANVDANIADPVWQYMQSSLTMTGLQVTVGGTVNFQWYDKFRSYKFLDLFRGLIDTYNLAPQTNPIDRIVTIEPTHDYVLPDGTQMPGYFVPQRLDWTDKQDFSKENVMQLYDDPERQFDFQFQLDGSDGGQNIYAARYKAIYLNNVQSTNFNNINNTNNDSGISAGIPGASRYMLPTRFQKGSRQMVNRFFSACMHYKHTKWANIIQLHAGGSPPPPLAPQLICIIPENVSDSSADSITQTFTPKIAYYSGQQARGGVGGWRWQGDPSGRGTDANGVGIPTYNDASDIISGQPLSGTSSVVFELPYMFAVDYSGWVASVPGQLAPALTYCDQNVNGAIVKGLMSTYFLKRMATMRNGKMYKPWMCLNLGDVSNWEHRNTIIINGGLYNLIAIDGYDPLSDSSCQCTLWKVTNPEQVDLDNCFPSKSSILTAPVLLAQFDLKYAPLLLFMTDIPEIN